MTNNEIKELRDQFIADAINAINGKLAVMHAQRDRVESQEGRDPQAHLYHLGIIRGAIEGLEVAMEVMPTAHLVPKVNMEAA